MTLISITGERMTGKTKIAQCLRDNLPGTSIMCDETSSISGLRQLILLRKVKVNWVIFDGVNSGRFIDFARDSNMNIITINAKSFR